MATAATTKAQNVHIVRYALHKTGLTVEEIAQKHGVSVHTIEKSIKTVDNFRLTNTAEFLNFGMVDTVLGRKNKLDKALDEALDAKITFTDGSKRPDHETRMKAVAEVRQLTAALQPKASGSRTVIQTNLSAQASSVAAAKTEGHFTGFEERMRSIRAKKNEHNLLGPPESVAPPLGEDEIEVGEEDAVDVKGD